MPYPYELEQLARETGVSPLETLEYYLERKGWRANHCGQDEATAEVGARSDCASYFRGSRPTFATVSRQASADASPLSSDTPAEPIAPARANALVEGVERGGGR